MATLTYDYGAAFDGDCAVFADATGTPEGHARVARTVACVNALDGIADPAAALAEVRRLLVEARDALRRSAEVYGGDAEEQVFTAEEACVAALALLGPAK
jgi:hypothetical protein